MRSITTFVVGVGGLLALWIGWGAYVDRTTERVPYVRLYRDDDVEIRRYPESVLVETTAPDAGTAFRRLFRYITGANVKRDEVAMTAPVATRDAPRSATVPLGSSREGGATVSMTAPVRSERDRESVTMAFYLPSAYAPETAPSPTDPTVSLVVEPPRTTAVRRFSWYATDRRVAAERRRLLEVLADRRIERLSDPAVLQYDDPWTPPFMRRNEVEVPVEMVDSQP